MSVLIDLTGRKFGRLIVLKRVANSKYGKAMWLCKCDCGKEKIIFGYNLKNGHTKSCGCLKRKHGHKTRTKVSKTYNSWYSMIQRCTNPNDTAYHNYGGRGITVCKRWRKFANFLKDMGEVPKGHQIDRVDNNKGYCKSNCRWVTAKINNRNRRNNRLITHNWKTQCISAWAEQTGLSKGVIVWRLNHGWSIAKALTTPVRTKE